MFFSISNIHTLRVKLLQYLGTSALNVFLCSTHCGLSGPINRYVKIGNPYAICLLQHIFLKSSASKVSRLCSIECIMMLVEEERVLYTNLEMGPFYCRIIEANIMLLQKKFITFLYFHV